MKRILSGAAILLACFGVQAQDALFPELQGSEPAGQPTPVSNQPVGQSLNQPARAQSTEPTDNQGTTPNQPAKTKATGEIIVRISDVQIVVPPIEKMQFCKGYLTLENNTKEEIAFLEIEMDYDPIKMPYRFGGLPAGESGRGEFGLVGPACQSLLRMAGIRVKACSVGDWTVAECQSHIKYELP